MRSFLQTPEIQARLRTAERVTIAHEKDVAEITGHQLHYWMPPPEQGKDLAEYNACEQAAARLAHEARSLADAARLARSWQKSAVKPWSETRAAIAATPSGCENTPRKRIMWPAEQYNAVFPRFASEKLANDTP